MRIVSGKYGGRLFRPPKSIQARPTTDFAKENLFNILENRFDFEKLTALDLFSGTGNISFELVSRGCRQVVAVEKNFRHIRFIREVANKLGIENLSVLRKDVFKFLASSNEQHDIIFADPPYQMEGVENLPELIFRYQLLKPGGYFILEHSKELVLPENQHLFEQRKYGHVHFSFYRTDS